MRVAGRPVPINDSEHPYTLLAHGQWQDAAEAWAHAGCPYEEALARAQSADPADLLAALAALDALGAEPLAHQVRLRLRSSASAASRVAASKPHETTRPDSPSGRPT